MKVLFYQSVVSSLDLMELSGTQSKDETDFI